MKLFKGTRGKMYGNVTDYKTVGMDYELLLTQIQQRKFIITDDSFISDKFNAEFVELEKVEECFMKIIKAYYSADADESHRRHVEAEMVKEQERQKATKATTKALQTQIKTSKTKTQSGNPKKPSMSLNLEEGSGELFA